VLALLLTGGGQPVSMSELVDLLWAADPPSSAANIVHRYIGALRRVLEPGLPHSGGYRLAADAGTLDLLRLRQLAGQAAAEEEPGRAVALYLEALGLCQGRCAGDLAAVREHPAFAAVDREYLALALVAARAAAHPQFPLAAIAGDLRAAQGSLDAFTGEGGTDVRAVFSWSYRMLSPLAARLFRLLSRHAGPEISLAAAASLAALPARQARTLLAELTRARLLTEYSPGRYSLHDLLRSYAAELCAETDPASHRDAATARLLSHYLHSARHGHLLLQPHQRLPDLEPLAVGAQPEQPGD
jgi:hypothetical protein